MGVQRMWNTYCPSFLKKNKNTVFIIFAIVCVIILCKFLLKQQPYVVKKRPCPSNDNFIQREDFAKSGLKIISSIPQRADPEMENTHDEVYSGDCVNFKTPHEKSLVICIHDPKKDLMVSAHIKKDGRWEKENVQAMFEAQEMFPDLVLVDLGSNIGAFSLSAASIDMEAIAVDSMLPSLKLLQRSLLINSLACPVTVIHNAVYSKRQQMRVALDPTNIGGSQVLEILDFRKNKIPKDQLVNAICLDDLIPLVQGRTVFLKMDLESTEVEVLKCADKFFSEVKVEVLLIEWMYYRNNEKASSSIKTFLLSHDMIPTWGIDLQRPIDVEASHSWPDNVFWRKVR